MHFSVSFFDPGLVLVDRRVVVWPFIYLDRRSASNLFSKGIKKIFERIVVEVFSRKKFQLEKIMGVLEKESLS